MRHSIRSACCVLAIAALATSAEAQIGVRAQVITENYSFSPGLSLSRITETTMPIGLNYDFGRHGSLAISTGYVTVDLTSAVAGLVDQHVATPLDTEFRFSFNLVPGKFVLLLNGALPTGSQTVERDELSILGAISSDVIGFSSPTVGSGGNFGGGFAGAIPLGRFAIGIGATAKKPLSYEPVAGDVSSLVPGAEFRVRLGLQGSLARNSYMRFALIYANRGKDDFANLTQNGVGDRLITYLSVNQAFGSSSVTAYGFGVHRGDPKVEAGASAALLTRGRLTAFGARADLRTTRNLTVSPRFELRTSKRAPSLTVTGLEKIGSSLRLGMDVTYGLGRSASLVIQGSYIDGDLTVGAADVAFDGYRLGAQLNWNPR